MGFVHVSGKDNKHKVVLYALSTCGWCRRTKELLVEEGVDHELIDVDLCTGEERAHTHHDSNRITFHRISDYARLLAGVS
jgi:hypothetical protein